MITDTLPPCQLQEPRPSWTETIVRWSLVVLAHVLVVYAALYFSVKNDLVQLPPSITARLLPMVEKKDTAAPPPLPKPTPAVRKPPQPQPILAAKAAEAPSTFVVAPQPPAPPPTPIAPAPAAPPVIAAHFDASYGQAPKPTYPALSRRNGEEGKVILRVKVSSQGNVLEIDIKQSSKYPRLDAAASEAVSRWRFVPARRGDQTIESWVLVPIAFTLE